MFYRFSYSRGSEAEPPTGRKADPEQAFGLLPPTERPIPPAL
jgi:hypothetical protein